MGRYFRGLWHDSNFRKFWFGQSVSLVGSEITNMALPLMAALLLKATPLQISLLNTAAFAPFILFTLLAGVWIDRHRRRPVMMVADVGRGLLTLLIPLLAWLRLLRMEYLYGIVFLTGSLNVLFELAYQSFLPSLLKREQLTEGNSKLFASASLAAISGPGIAGVLVEVLTAPVALLIDGISFWVSALSLWAINRPEPAAFLAVPRQSIWQDIKMGLRMMVGNRYLRAFAGEAATYNFFYSTFASMFILYGTRQLELTPGTIGLIFAVGSVGSLAGSVLATPLANRYGVGMAILTSCAVSCGCPLLVPFASTYLASGRIVVFMLAFFMTGMGTTLTIVHTFSMRQAMIPAGYHGRVLASYRFLTWTPIPVGTFVCGFLAEVIGLQGILWVSAAGLLTAWFWLWAAPLVRLRETPLSVAAPEAATA